MDDINLEIEIKGKKFVILSSYFLKLSSWILKNLFDLIEIVFICVIFFFIILPILIDLIFHGEIIDGTSSGSNLGDQNLEEAELVLEDAFLPTL